jgi:hypothetical protein
MLGANEPIKVFQRGRDLCRRFFRHAADSKRPVSAQCHSDAKLFAKQVQFAIKDSGEQMGEVTDEHIGSYSALADHSFRCLMTLAAFGLKQELQAERDFTATDDCYWS